MMVSVQVTVTLTPCYQPFILLRTRQGVTKLFYRPNNQIKHFQKLSIQGCLYFHTYALKSAQLSVYWVLVLVVLGSLLKAEKANREQLPNAGPRVCRQFSY